MRQRLSLLFIVFSFMTLPAAAFTPKEGYTKVVISHRLMPVPDASAPARILEFGGGQVVQEYPGETVAYFLSDTIKSLYERAAALGIEILAYDDFDKIYLPEGVIDARLGTAKSLPDKPLNASYGKGETGVLASAHLRSMYRTSPGPVQPRSSRWWPRMLTIPT